ncbi:PAS domain-containing protein [Alkalimonas collagenimarina]|uniref:PAS domain-containing protein n=1 Tax=Alkalimonas collagenimarina TaxID=400390 RepID=A0ABT9GWC6_9GAMM|nr:PAS domain-containing protein [Alkalimonas collagenimarina]MDP4535346.1 PAS domain-containing protein [Alkalimonas collagenimarina]
MSDPILPWDLTIKLRQQAEQQLKTGSTQLNAVFTASTDALSALFRLSSEANTASDGLKLLHELQTYQVELDLQMEQLQHNESDANHQLACYRQFFDLSPIGCIIINLNGIITDCNAAAAGLFAHLTNDQTGQLCGISMQSLVTANCQPMLSASLARVQRSQQNATLIVTAVTGSGNSADPCNLRLTISLSPDQKAILLMLADDASEHRLAADEL